MVAEKRPPALRRCPKAAAHIPSDCRLGDLEAQLEQLTMNAWCAPESVCAAHLANQRAQLHQDLGSANTVARPPAPIRPKAGTVPANDRLRPDNRNRAKDGGKPAIEPNKRKRSEWLRCGRFNDRRRSTLNCCPRTSIHSSTFVLVTYR